MANHSKNNKKRDIAICKMAAQGKSQAEISKVIGGIGQTGVSRIVRKEENRKLIETETTKLLASLPDIVGQFDKNVKLSEKLLDWLNDPQDLYEDVIEKVDGVETTVRKVKFPTRITDVKDAISFLTQAYKQKADMLKALGVFPSQNLSMFIQNIYNDNSQQVLNPKVFEAFGSMFANTTEEEDEADIIDIEPEED
jgi:hypothetical protein